MPPFEQMHNASCIGRCAPTGQGGKAATAAPSPRQNFLQVDNIYPRQQSCECKIRLFNAGERRQLAEHLYADCVGRLPAGANKKQVVCRSQRPFFHIARSCSRRSFSQISLRSQYSFFERKRGVRGERGNLSSKKGFLSFPVSSVSDSLCSRENFVKRLDIFCEM